jgi:thiamine biosynthesis lipoprotein
MNSGSFRAMGSYVTWCAECDSGNELRRWFEEVEQCCSRFRPESELSRLNRDPREEVEISSLLQDLFSATSRAHELSGGLVDPTILDALEAAGYDRDLPVARRRPRRPPPNTHSWVDVVSKGNSVMRPPGLRIDLGGIAKSWTAASALELVEGRAFVDAAGDVAVRGLWTVQVEHGGEHVTALAVEDGGVATSGVDRRKWKDGHHIIDPSTRRPARTDVVAATVVADSATTAETVARTILLMGSWEGLGWAESVEGVRGAIATTSRDVTLAIPTTAKVLA